MLREKMGGRGAVTVIPPLDGAVTVAKLLLTRPALSTRLLVAGVLLLVGLPALTILVYVWGYPSTTVPLPVAIVVDGLQLLIVLNALVAVSQLLTGIGIRMPWAASERTRKGKSGVASTPVRRNGPVGLHALSLDLAESIWEHERNGHSTLGQSILDYIRDAVVAELEHRRRTSALERRLSELEVKLSGRTGVRRGDDRR
jgi:hypothetical protein